MMHPSRTAAVFILGLTVLLALVGSAAASQASRLIVENQTYSSLQISMIDGDGRETRLGQAPPEFANTLLIAEPLPDAPVRFLARLVGENDVLYRSEPVQIAKDHRVRWKLPDNTIGR